MLRWMTAFLDPTHLIDTFGLIGIMVVLFGLGGAPVVREHVELFVLGVVALSPVPVLVEVVRSRQGQRNQV